VADFSAELRASLGAGFPIVVVVSHEEARVREILDATFGAERIRAWTATEGLAGDAKLRDPVLAIQHATASSAPLHVFYDLHPFLGEPRVVRALRDFALAVREAKSVRALILASPFPEVPAELDRDVAQLELPLPTSAEVGALFDAEAPRRRKHAPVDRDAFARAALGLTRAEAQRAFRLALAVEDPAGALHRLVVEKRRVLRRSSTLELVDSDVSLEAVGGLDVLKGWLKSRVLAFDQRAQAFGLAEPRGMLVCGVQGCGKSLVSKAASVVLGLPLVRLDFADVFASPSPERAMREATRVVEAIAPVVLWVDEVEKGLGADAGDGRQVRVFGAFLTWLQERRAPVFVAATANEVDRLPPELARRGRFDEVFFVDLPSAKEREEILALHLVRRNRDPGRFAIADVAKDLEHFSGAELEQVVTSALFRAFAQKRELTDADVRSAAREVVPLAVLYEEKVQALRTWGKARARRASADRRTLELFES
jgi:AAA+ superfamily predicted ATPase